MGTFFDREKIKCYFDDSIFSSTLEDLLKIFDENNYCLIAEETVNGYAVSTAWIDLPTSKKRNFETIVVRNDEIIFRSIYQTLEEAQQGHDKLIDKYLNFKN